MLAQVIALPIAPHAAAIDHALFDDERRLNDEVRRFGATLDESAMSSGIEYAQLRRMLRAMLNVSGKRVRPLLPFWMARAFPGGGNDAAIDRVAATTLLLHSAAIVIDDIEDGSTERQCQPSLHLREGHARTLNAASLLVFKALEHLDSPWLEAVASKAVLNCHMGQALDLDAGVPEVAAALFAGTHAERVARYRACAELKTSQLMEMSVLLAGRVLGRSSEEMERITAAVRDFGFAYQILDDAKNFRPDLVGNKAYEDLDAGLKSWVCLELISAMTPAQVDAARLTYGTPVFRELVLEHPGLGAALARSIDAGVRGVRAATAALEASCADPRARGYVTALLGRPVEDLAEGLLHG